MSDDCSYCRYYEKHQAKLEARIDALAASLRIAQEALEPLRLRLWERHGGDERGYEMLMVALAALAEPPGETTGPCHDENCVHVILGVEHAHAVSRDSTRGTAPKTCWAWCGFNCQHPDICGKKVHFCTKACAAAGKPLHPATPPSTRGTCGTCGGKGRVLSPLDGGGPVITDPCPDCAPRSEVKP